MIAAVFFRADQVWFFKATADGGLVAWHKPGFVEMARSVRFAAPSVDADSDTEGDAEARTSARPSPISWTTPDGWAQDVRPGRLLFASFKVRQGDHAVAVTVNRFAGEGGGGCVI